MALVVTPSQQVWQNNEQPDSLINVFLKMWDGKVRFCVPKEDTEITAWRRCRITRPDLLLRLYLTNAPLLMKDTLLSDRLKTGGYCWPWLSSRKSIGILPERVEAELLLCHAVKALDWGKCKFDGLEKRIDHRGAISQQGGLLHLFVFHSLHYTYGACRQFLHVWILALDHSCSPSIPVHPSSFLFVSKTVNKWAWGSADYHSGAAHMTRTICRS